VFANTPEPPYYAVIFTSVQTEDTEGYAAMAAEMERLAEEQPGYLGIESAREGIGITVSYWKDEASIRAWKQHVEHLKAQAEGRNRWYSSYITRICRVERDYSFD